MISELSANLAKIFLVIGVPFVFFKSINKNVHNYGYTSFYQKTKRPFYQLHVNATKIGIILAFVHGFTVQPISQTYILTGWLLGIIMIVLLGLGAFLSIKNKSHPMDTGKDLQWKTIRHLKWVLGICVLVSLFLHYLPMMGQT